MAPSPSRDDQGHWRIDAQATSSERRGVRRARIARSRPTREWMREERERILAKQASTQVQHMFATSFGLSEKFERQFRDFWNLPEDWQLDEQSLGVPSYGSKFRMDLGLLPDVHPVTLVEE